MIDVSPMIRLYKTKTSVLLADFLYCLVGLHVFMKQAAIWDRPRWQGIEGSPSQQPLGTEVPSPATHKKLNSSTM